MKYLIILAFSALALPSISEASDGYNVYADRILMLEEQGHINHEDAQEKVLALRLRDHNKDQALKRQARGVASAIRNKRVIKITNKAIEISVEESEN